MSSPLTVTLAPDGVATFHLGDAVILYGPLVHLADARGHAFALSAPTRRDVPGVARLRWDFEGAAVTAAVARVADGAVVWRVEVRAGTAVPLAGTVATALRCVDPIFGLARRLPGLGAVVADGAGGGIAHTFVPDAGTTEGPNPHDTSDGFGIARGLRLAPSTGAGFTAVLATGTTERAALEALFPFLSGERSRDALRTAHRDARARPSAPPGP